MDLRLYKDNSMVLLLEGLENHRGESIPDATVTATLSRAGLQVWTGTLVPVEGEAGAYEAGLAPADSAAMTVGELLRCVVEATAGGLTFSDTLTAKVRTR